METQENLISATDAVKLLQKHLDQSRQTLVFFIHFLTEVARYAETDARNRASKYIPSAKDLQVNTKIAGNELLWKILEHPSYVQALKEDKPHLINEEDLTKRIYSDLVATDKYKHYIGVQSRERREEKDILEFILTDLMLPNEHFISFVEERFPNWDDDADMLNNLLTAILSKPAALNLQELVGPEKVIFANDLLRTAVEKKEVTMDYIKPKLKNWDPERIAILDMILMRMGPFHLK
jgi:N utilization substance protein B